MLPNFEFPELLQGPLGIGAAILLLAVGLLLLFFGWAAFRVSLIVMGMLLGFVAGSAIANLFSIPWLIIGLPMALISAWLATKMVKLGAFFLGAACGTVPILMLRGQFSPGAGFGVAVALAALIGGILAIYIWRPMIIVSLAIIGASLVLNAAALLLDYFKPGLPKEMTLQHPVITGLIFMALTFLGVYRQGAVINEKSNEG